MAVMPAPVAVMPVMPAADAARTVIGPDHAAARAIGVRVIAAVESRSEEMPAAKMTAMTDEAMRPADEAAAKTAAMKATMKAAAMEAAAAVETAAMTSATMTSAAVTATAAADLDQSVGDEFRGQRRRARTCQRQRLRALRRHQHQQQHRRRHYARARCDQAFEIAARILNENCIGTSIAGHNKSLPEICACARPSLPLQDYSRAAECIMNARAAMMNGVGPTARPVARMERSAIRGGASSFRVPDFASLHPGYECACCYQPKPKSKPSGNGAGM
jgi:hypothetical protein